MIFTLFAFAGWIATLLFWRREIQDHRHTLDRFQTYLDEHKAFREAAMRVINDLKNDNKA